MDSWTEIERRSRRLNEKLGKYIPPSEAWTPAEEALYRPTDPLRVPIEEAQQMQLKAIKYAFAHHYNNNTFYHNYCREKNVSPDDIKTNDDLEKIPCIPDLTFKTHPSGKDFAYWITGIFTGDLPTVVIEGADPTFDDILSAFNAAGLEIGYTSGTSGRPSVVPRDVRTLRNLLYAFMKAKVGLWDDDPDHALSLFPKPTDTNLMAGKMMILQSQVYRDHQFAIDFDITADKVRKAMMGKDQYAAAPQSAYEMRRRILDRCVTWLERYEKTSDTILLDGPPGIFSQVMDALDEEGKRFDFGERGLIWMGGGWKTREDEGFSPERFRKRVEEVLGIPETRCLQGYGMTEMNAGAFTCPEGHFYHLTYAWLKPLVLDISMEPVGDGERGRFAFLDGLAGSYPGFIITGDEVRMYEHCPACDRPGPVLDEMIDRAPSEELRGCNQVVVKVLEQEIKRRSK